MRWPRATPRRAPPRLVDARPGDGDPDRPRPRAADARTRRPPPRRRRSGASSGPRQSGPPCAGPRQPPVERDALHAGRRHGHASGPNGARRTSWSRSRTPATGSRRPTSSTSSNASIASRSRAIGRAAGAGIGLAIVKQLVEAGGGRVGAESRRGRDPVLVQPPGLTHGAVTGWRCRPSRSGSRGARTTGPVGVARRGTRRRP